jgi:hypothetical protein
VERTRKTSIGQLSHQIEEGELMAKADGPLSLLGLFRANPSHVEEDAREDDEDRNDNRHRYDARIWPGLLGGIDDNRVRTSGVSGGSGRQTGVGCRRDEGFWVGDGKGGTGRYGGEKSARLGVGDGEGEGDFGARLPPLRKEGESVGPVGEGDVLDDLTRQVRYVTSATISRRTEEVYEVSL